MLFYLEFSEEICFKKYMGKPYNIGEVFTKRTSV